MRLINKDLMSNFLQKTSHLTDHTKTCYIGSLDLYSRFIGDNTPNMENVKAFMTDLEEAEYTVNSINRHIFAIKKFFSSNGLEWEDTIKAQFVNLFDTDTPTISREDLGRVIIATKKHGNLVDMSYLALSSIYGLRRQELAEISNNRINKQKSTIHIRSIKHGLERDHLIPDQIGFIKDYNFEEQKLPTISLLFSKIALLAGYNRESGEGWHSIRRALVSGLFDNEISDASIEFFMRWSPKNISRRYNTQGKNPSVADAKIFAKHPFLPFWESKNAFI